MIAIGFMLVSKLTANSRICTFCRVFFLNATILSDQMKLPVIREGEREAPRSVYYK